MLTPYRPAILAACFAILCTVTAWAQNQNSTSPSNQAQQQAQSDQQNSPQLNAPASDQNSNSQQNQSNQQQAQQNQQSSDQSSSIRNEGVAGGQQDSSQAQSNQSSGRDTQRNASDQSSGTSRSSQQNQSSKAGSSASSNSSNTRDWPAPERYEYRGRIGSSTDRGNAFQYNNQQGQGRRRASLGVNIISGDNGRGITVMRTQPNTAADRMGLQPRDRIVSLNGQPVESVDDFIGAIGTMNPGDQVELTVERNGNERTIRGTLEAYAESITRFEGPVAQGLNRIRGIIGRDRGPDVAEDRGNIQTSYEDQGGSSSRSSSGDADARIGRLEQQIDRLNREIQELREAHNSSQPGSAAPSGSSSERSGSSNQGSSSSQPGNSSSSSSNSGAGSNSTSPGTSGGNIPAPSSSQSR